MLFEWMTVVCPSDYSTENLQKADGVLDAQRRDSKTISRPPSRTSASTSRHRRIWTQIDHLGAVPLQQEQKRQRQKGSAKPKERERSARPAKAKHPKVLLALNVTSATDSSGQGLALLAIFEPTPPIDEQS